MLRLPKRKLEKGSGVVAKSFELGTYTSVCARAQTRVGVRALTHKYTHRQKAQLEKKNAVTPIWLSSPVKPTDEEVRLCSTLKPCF